MDNPWVEESPLVDEYEFSGWKTGFSAWNVMSPELEFCNVAAAVVEALPSNAIIIETGMGQGYVTRRIKKALHGRQTFIAYETGDIWIEMANEVNHGIKILLGNPGVLAAGSADFTVLDSEPVHRVKELEYWINYGKSRSLMLIHDTYHHVIEDGNFTSQIKRAGLIGCWLPNPRGSFLGVHQ